MESNFLVLIYDKPYLLLAVSRRPEKQQMPIELSLTWKVQAEPAWEQLKPYCIWCFYIFFLCPYLSSQIVDVKTGNLSYFVVSISFCLSSSFEFCFFLPAQSKTVTFGKISGQYFCIMGTSVIFRTSFMYLNTHMLIFNQKHQNLLSLQTLPKLYHTIIKLPCKQ